MELSDLYSAKLLEIAGNARDPGRLVAPQGQAARRAKLCGSTIEVDVVLENGVIAAYGHKVRACALGQTSAAIVAAEAVGTPADEIRRVRDEMVKMLKEDGPPPEGDRWGDLKYLEPVRGFPARHDSTLLVFEALCDAIRQAEAAP